MALIILDPNLDGEGGHHLAYDLAIATAAAERGQEVRIVANRRFPARAAGGVPVLPHFAETCYAMRHDDPVTGRFDDFRHFNDTLLADLRALPAEGLRPEDCVLVPTVTETHLAGFVGWMKGFDPTRAPLFVVHLMMPSGVTIGPEGALVVEDAQRALFYRLAERAARGPGPAVHLFATGGQHAAEYGALFGRPVPAHPLPIRPEPLSDAPAGAPAALLFAGDARLDKGIGLLPSLAPALTEAHPDWRFQAHVNTERAWGEAKAAGEALMGLAGSLPNLSILGGWLTEADYRALLGGARLVLLPYDPALARRKSSGVLWEAISLGIPVVVPAGTWLEHEARHWGAGHVTYAAQSPEAIAAAMAEAIAALPALAARSAEAGARYRACNGAAALIDQLASLWVPHQAAASLLARPERRELDLARLSGGWHVVETVEGKAVRWTEREPVIAFDWPFTEGWEVELAVLAVPQPGQIEDAEAWAGGERVALRWLRQGNGGRLLLRGPGPGRARPRVEVRLRLAGTVRPGNDARDLGVLVRGVAVGPGEGVAPVPAALPRARVLGAAEGPWPVAPVLGGEVVAAPGAGCAIAFTLRAGSDAAIGTLALHVEGMIVPLAATAEGSGIWLATAGLPAALLARGTGWSLVAGEGGAVELLAVSAAPMEGAVPTATPAAAVLPAGLRWSLAEGVGPEEGPFPEIGVPAGVRWVTEREARLVVESPVEGRARLAITHRCILPVQEMRATVNGVAAGSATIRGGPLTESGQSILDLPLRAGSNEVTLAFAGSVREPGSGRRLVLLLERVEIGLAG